jgi:hypothetical protein
VCGGDYNDACADLLCWKVLWNEKGIKVYEEGDEEI